MVKRNLLLATLLMLSLAVAACSTGSSTSTTTGTDTATASADGAAPAQGELSAIARNILGIFKLEDTDLAVDSAQAATLLPLWQAYRSLLNSDTAASAELEAVKTQIDETLTAEQKDAIAAMSLTSQDMFAMAEELGVTQAAASSDGTDSSTTRPSLSAGGFPGGAGGGAPPSGGGGSMPAPPSGGGGMVIQGEGGMPAADAGGFDPSMMMGGTPQPGHASGRQGDRFSLALLDPLIELLKERAAS
ncbi:MAG: hypothetical protein NTU91_10835 [Chloroflexi bacterium]|nr:hypothetical protein [Chloroflexota bacterium]